MLTSFVAICHPPISITVPNRRVTAAESGSF